jgi:acyl carrier protein
MTAPTRAEALHDIEQVVSSILGQPVTLTDDMLFEQIVDWDSMLQTRTMVGIESRCGVLFDIDELASLSTVGAVLDAVERKRGESPPRV